MSVIFEAIQDAQRIFHDAVAGNLTALRDGGSYGVAWALITASFLYGVFHAAGPGHGKVIVGAYMLADGGTLRRGLWVTALSSLLQGVVAVALVLGLYYGLGLARQKTELAAAWFEAGSFALVALIGAHMVWRGLRAFRHRGCGDETCGHDHHHDVHGRKSMAAMVFSIGIRPCSGGLLVMFFACLVGQIAAGIAATFAMAVGTGMTTSAIAIVAAGSRHGLLKFLGGSDARMRTASSVIRILGGILLLSLGVLFALAAMPQNNASSGHAHPLMKQRVE